MATTIFLDYAVVVAPTIQKIYTQHNGTLVVRNGEGINGVRIYDYRNAANGQYNNTHADSVYLVNKHGNDYEFRVVMPVATQAEVKHEKYHFETVSREHWVYPAEPANQVLESSTVLNFSGNPAAPTEAEKKAAWFKRLENAYKAGITLTQDWWVRAYGTLNKRTRANNVLNIEIPNWWTAVIACAAGAVAGRETVPNMTDAQIEACVKHIEDLLNSNYAVLGGKDIMEVWYEVGVSKDNATDYANSALTTIVSTNPANPYYRRAYSDTFTIEIISNQKVLVPRTPDYEWNEISIHTPTSFDPNNPS